MGANVAADDSDRALLIEDTVDLSAFSPVGLERGRPKFVEIIWRLTNLVVVQTSFPWPSAIRRAVLVAFGAKIGKGFYIRPSVKVHFPWKLTIGENVWIGEGCTLLNLEPIEIRSNAALAHEVYVSTGNHDLTRRDFPYANASVLIDSSTWIGTRAFVGSGVTIGRGAVVAAGAVVVKDVDPWSVVGGVPARKISVRRLSDGS